MVIRNPVIKGNPVMPRMVVAVHMREEQGVMVLVVVMRLVVVKHSSKVEGQQDS